MRRCAARRRLSEATTRVPETAWHRETKRRVMTVSGPETCRSVGDEGSVKGLNVVRSKTGGVQHVKRI